MEWKGLAHRLFFNEHLSIVDISIRVEKTRQTVSNYLSTQEGYEAERNTRKAKNQIKREGYKKKWDHEKRKRTDAVDAAMIKRQHNIDVQVLSHEKF